MEQYFIKGNSIPVFTPELSISGARKTYFDNRFKNPIFSSPNLSGAIAYINKNNIYKPVASVKLGSFIEDVLDPGGLFHEGGIFGIQQFTQAVVKGIQDVAAAMAEIISKIDWQKIAHVFMVELNPLHWTYMAMSTNPYTEHMFRELDHFTGGLITSVENITTLSGRVLRGDAISKQELVSDVIFVVKVALVIVSGGTAAAIIAASSDQLKAGYLGETETGRAILTIATAAALAYAAGESIMNATKNSAVGLAQGEGEKQLIQKTPLGESEAGRIIAGAGTRGAGAGILGNSVTGAVTSYSETAGKNIAKKELAEEIGGPYASQIANTIVEQGYPPSTSTQDSNNTNQNSVLNNVWEEIKRSPDNVVNAIKNFNISVSNGESTGSKIDINPSDAGVARSGSGNPILSLPELNIKGLEFPPKDLSSWENLMCKIKFASTLTSAQSTGLGALPVNASLNSQGQIVVDDPLAKGVQKVCAKARKKIKVGNEWLWIYALEDGTYYWTFDEITIDETNKYLLYGLIAVAALIIAKEVS